MTTPTTNPLEDLLKVLDADTSALLKAVGSSLDDVHKRSVIRAIFANIEAQIWVFKQKYLEQFGDECSPIQIAFIKEEVCSLSENGEILVKPAKIPMATNVRFALTLWEKRSGETDLVDYKGTGWQAFRRAVKIRDRLTHPKKPEDLVVTPMELRETFDASEWFGESRVAVIGATLVLLKRELEASQAKFNEKEARVK